MIGVVLAGGESRRFGGRPKGLLPFRGRAMALTVADMLGGFCDRVVIEASSSAGYEIFGLPLVHARSEDAGKGPLAGLAAGLHEAGADERVAFAPCDMPLLARATYDVLATADDPGAYARTEAGVEPLVTVLHASLLSRLLAALEQDELPRTHVVLDAAGVCAIGFDDPAPFANVNTRADLERLAALSGST
jgi:molybdenum cofactor guanylyltransferase